MYQAVIVDDEEFVLEDLKTALDWSGFLIEICYETTNPLDALDYLKTHGVDLLITDISMPQMDGIELIRRAKESNPLLSILVLSAYDNFDYVRSAMRNGAENYLLKPLDPDELAESVSRITGHIMERAEMSQTYGSSMLTFRSIFIESWTNGTLSDEEFITRAQMLGINFQLDNYTVLIFSADPRYSRQMPRLLDYLLSAFFRSWNNHFYFATPFRLVTILSGTAGAVSRDVFTDTIKRARQILGCPFFVSIGSTADNYEEVSESYRLASQYLFLEHTALPYIDCDGLSLPLPLLNQLRQEFGATSLEAYRSLVRRLASSIPKSRQGAFYLSVLSWAGAQTWQENQDNGRIRELLQDFSEDMPDSGQLLDFLDRFLEECFTVLARRKSDSIPCVDAVIQAVHEFSDKNISLKTLAARLNMHPSYLGTVFHQQTGFYFNDYLNEERLKYAVGLMENTSMKLKDIVDQAGFSSQTYFNRLFKRRYGTPPNAYRRELKMKQN